MNSRKMKLGLFFEPSGRHISAWRHPKAHPQASVSTENLVQIAQAAERGLMDFVFIADTNNVWEDMEYFKRIERASVIDPMLVLTVLSQHTKHVGLIATISTTYTQPFHLARSFASLDLVSHGRAGWNVVTSMFPGESKNFVGDRHMAHADRYKRAEEFVDVVKGLWRSFDHDAFVRDKESGLYVDPEKMHVLNHVGEFFSVRGPLNVPRSEQGHPVIVQAGSSGPGRDLAARTAEVVFTAMQKLEEASAFYQDLKGRLAQYGRTENELLILPGVSPIMGETESEAQEKYEELQSLLHPAVGISLLSTLLGGFDLSGYPVDGPLPEIPETEAGKGRQVVIVEQARRENLTIRQLYEKIICGRGHWQPIGTYKQVADQLEEWFVNRGADGFNIMPPSPPDLEKFCRFVIPELQRRGLFRTEYEGGTLRENLGLRIA
ncbi:LLM class flavin-dependent oxidoreductase [Gluconacetobacter johannae]|uniref:LLM class flavin-dependent oxidoreductase n=2 Tax=Gluconacetobacter johannae TaxID=112140 RepID=A0A7W4P2V9_9PROT|nr:LLM class flavin-dependent oxidoreductase [Gluconacetobacter johannae]MBB2175214.1 LLM class flavin-dependent oxidoreductase [Gluconacetobacter johannae]